MAYGAVITNVNGSEVIGEAETAYLYWGKVTVTGAGGNLAVLAELFNIPTSIPVKVYTYHNVMGQRSLLDSVNATWRIRTFGNPPLGISMDVYVFVPAEYAPLPAFGMAIWNSSNKLKFHTGRPPVRVQGIHTINKANLWADVVTLSYKPAAQSFLFQTERTSGSGPTFDVYNMVTAAGKLVNTPAGQYRVGMDEHILGNIGAPIQYQTGNQFSFGYIDATFYDGYSNLSNWA